MILCSVNVGLMFGVVEDRSSGGNIRPLRTSLLVLYAAHSSAFTIMEVVGRYALRCVASFFERKCMLLTFSATTVQCFLIHGRNDFVDLIS